MKNEEVVHCEIEHHATLFALFSNRTIKRFPERGEKIIFNAIEKYGHERGKRMAERAIRNGDSLDFINSQAYGEWVPKEGQMEFGIIKTEPEFVSKATKCEWCESWKKHNLLQYGKYYCVNIDSAVFNGFNENFHMTVSSNLSFGADRCEFHFGQPMSDEDMVKLSQKKAELGTSCTRDFNFHTAHLLNSISETLISELGEEGKLIINEVLEEYIALFGKEYLDVLEEKHEKN